MVVVLIYITNKGKGKWKLLPGIEEITEGQAHTNKLKLYRDILTGTAVTSDAIFVMCSQTFTLFRLIKTAMPVEISRYSFHLFVCDCPSVISSIPGKSFHFPFPLFVIFVLRYFPFHVVYIYIYIYYLIGLGISMSEYWPWGHRFDSRDFHNFTCELGLERRPLSFMRTIG